MKYIHQNLLNLLNNIPKNAIKVTPKRSIFIKKVITLKILRSSSNTPIFKYRIKYKQKELQFKVLVFITQNKKIYKFKNSFSENQKN